VPIECAAVVKADAYGCGLDPVTTAARQGRLQDLLRGQSGRRSKPCGRSRACAVIYVLNGLQPHTAQAFADANLRPVINGPAEARRMGCLLRLRLAPAAAALHVDTGMNRLGLSPDERGRGLLAGAAREPRLHAPDEPSRLRRAPSHPMNDRQIRMFRELRILFRGVSSSLANSSGIFLGGGDGCIAIWCVPAWPFTAAIRRRARPIR